LFFKGFLIWHKNAISQRRDKPSGENERVSFKTFRQAFEVHSYFA
jgi:hypothetical protein